MICYNVSSIIEKTLIGGDTMSFNSNASNKRIIEYQVDDTYSALMSALEKDMHFSVKTSDPTSRTIAIKTGVSWKSWGENLLITLSPTAENMTELSITSTSKYGAIDWGKNQDNLSKILEILFEELKNYEKIIVNNTDLAGNIPAQIKQLSELRDIGILTDEEFQQKKEELLARL